MIIILGESGKTHGNKAAKKRKKPQHPNSYPSGKIVQVPVTHKLACRQFTVNRGCINPYDGDVLPTIPHGSILFTESNFKGSGMELLFGKNVYHSKLT